MIKSGLGEELTRRKILPANFKRRWEAPSREAGKTSSKSASPNATEGNLDKTRQLFHSAPPKSFAVSGPADESDPACIARILEILRSGLLWDKTSRA